MFRKLQTTYCLFFVNEGEMIWKTLNGISTYTFYKATVNVPLLQHLSEAYSCVV